jgi:hypothetical protein
MFRQEQSNKSRFRQPVNAGFQEKPGDFCELSSSSTQIKSLNFQKIVKILEEPEPVKKESTMIDYSKVPGWVVFTQVNRNRNTMTREEEPEEPEVYNVAYDLYKMAQRWEEYKLQYDELHGEDAYHRDHEMPDSYCYNEYDEEYSY